MSNRRARRVQVPSILGEQGIRAETPKRRFLFAVPPVARHVAPTVAVAAELAGRGHKVAWTGDRAALEPLLRAGSRIYSAGDDAFTAHLRETRAGRLRLRGPAALRSHWEDVVVPLGHAMLPGVDTAIDRFRPDALICDQQVLAGPVAARLRGLPWATAAATPAEFARPLAGTPLLERWVRDQIGDFQLDHGIEDLLDLRFSDHLVLVFSTGALLGDVSFFPDHFAFVGPVPGRSAAAAFPWERLDGRPAVLFDLGTPDGPDAERFLRVAADAVRGLDVQAVLAAPPGTVADPPPNVLVREHVPRAGLLERASAIVCRGGFDTVGEALGRGVPMVLAAARDDEPVVAGQVERAGAGVPVRFARGTSGELRTALGEVLTDPAYRDAAGRVRDSFAAAGGAAEAADRLEKLA
ncbi:glycosyltransferase [Actinomadura algeriensis]|uniref:MGT family glycosyltransferase n=1 Tax=Actinomadura algeriensis TaxID=1679523 RepID=A0ABR9K4Q2_9ACTN|nr:nucleotide disphospho-sugar-binding domain-containing protein [Actinomadura algeriensis]MBE1537814.1 MGT family glycosyltransferase [Actinomadura algeriensis]